MSLVAASGSIALEGDGKSKLKWLDISTIYHTSLITSRKESLLMMQISIQFYFDLDYPIEQHGQTRLIDT